MENEARKTIEFLQRVRRAIDACDKRILTIFAGQIENRVDKDFGEFEEEVKEEYLLTLRLVEEKKRSLDIINNQ